MWPLGPFTWAANLVISAVIRTGKQRSRKTLGGVSYLNLDLGVRRMDLIGGRMYLSVLSRDVGGRSMDLIGRRSNLIGAIMIGEVNFAGILDIFGFFIPKCKFGGAAKGSSDSTV